MRRLLDLRGNIPSFIHISEGKPHDINILDQLIPEAGALYVMDRGYIDLQRLYRLHQAGSFFVTRAKWNMDAQRRFSHPVDRSTGVIFDQALVLQHYQAAKDCPQSFRTIRYKDPQAGKRLLFITNNTALPALKICDLYKVRTFLLDAVLSTFALTPESDHDSKQLILVGTGVIYDIVCKGGFR